MTATDVLDPDDALAALALAVDQVLNAHAEVEALEARLTDLRQSVVAAHRAERDFGWGTARSIAEVIGDNLGDLRRRSGWTQDQLSEAMSSMGFTWNRQTVAETERGAKRRASYEELFALAALFAVPAVALLSTPSDAGVELNDDVQLDGATAAELLIGRQGRVGTGGPAWRAAARACASVEARPATALARNTRGDQ